MRIFINPIGEKMDTEIKILVRFPDTSPAICTLSLKNEKFFFSTQDCPRPVEISEHLASELEKKFYIDDDDTPVYDIEHEYIFSEVPYDEFMEKFYPGFKKEYLRIMYEWSRRELAKIK